jgi:hypothetical protein
MGERQAPAGVVTPSNTRPVIVSVRRTSRRSEHSEGGHPLEKATGSMTKGCVQETTQDPKGSHATQRGAGRRSIRAVGWGHQTGTLAAGSIMSDTWRRVRTDRVRGGPRSRERNGKQYGVAACRGLSTPATSVRRRTTRSSGPRAHVARPVAADRGVDMTSTVKWRDTSGPGVPFPRS